MFSLRNCDVETAKLLRVPLLFPALTACFLADLH
jgi:hypothetical protein